jgi:hypothetical protein
MFVAEYRSAFGVAPLLKAIGEPESTYFDRVSRPASARAIADDKTHAWPIPGVSRARRRR